MTSIENVETTAQNIQARIVAILKALSLVITTATGAGVSVRKVLFAHWDLVAPLAEGSTFGMVLVATLATLVTFLFSLWLCLLSGHFSKVLAAVRPEPTKADNKQ